MCNALNKNQKTKYYTTNVERQSAVDVRGHKGLADTVKNQLLAKFIPELNYNNSKFLICKAEEKLR